MAGSRPLITMVDQEGGRVQRLGAPFTTVPAANKIGSTNDVAAAGAIGSVIGRELRSVYIDMDLAPAVRMGTLALVASHTQRWLAFGNAELKEESVWERKRESPIWISFDFCGIMLKIPNSKKN